MAEVIHRYEPSPLSAERVAERKAEVERQRAERRRKEAEKRAERRVANRGVATLRKERAAHEKLKRMRLEMEVAVRRGVLIERDVALRQAAFLMVAFRARCMSAPSAWARRLLNISDPREMVTRLGDMMMSLLEELANLPEKVTGGDVVGDESGGGLTEDRPGPIGSDVGSVDRG